jgi:D-arabinose 1-dehydrogenase-like Zn-dependent alcohol dehydrogenase
LGADYLTNSPKAFHAVDSCELKPDQWFAVIGCGGLGQLATQYAKAMGFKVVGLDINDSMLEVAKKAGADVVFNSMTNKDYVEELKKVTGGGAHAAAVFSNAQAAYNGAPAVLRLGGLMMIIGITAKPIPISTMDMTLGRYRIKAESTSIPQRMPRAIEFSGKHNIVPEVEYRKLEDVQAMIDDMEAGRAKTRMAVVF